MKNVFVLLRLMLRVLFRVLVITNCVAGFAACAQASNYEKQPGPSSAESLRLQAQAAIASATMALPQAEVQEPFWQMAPVMKELATPTAAKCLLLGCSFSNRRARVLLGPGTSNSLDTPLPQSERANKNDPLFEESQSRTLLHLQVAF